MAARSANAALAGKADWARRSCKLPEKIYGSERVLVRVFFGMHLTALRSYVSLDKSVIDSQIKQS